MDGRRRMNQPAKRLTSETAAIVWPFERIKSDNRRKVASTGSSLALKSRNMFANWGRTKLRKNTRTAPAANRRNAG